MLEQIKLGTELRPHRGCARTFYTATLLLEIRLFSVDEEAEGGQRCTQFRSLTAGCRKEGVVL